MRHPDPWKEGDDPESSPPPVPEERGGLLPPIRWPPTSLGPDTPDPFGGFGGRFQIERRLPWPYSWTALLARDLTQDRLVVLRVLDPRISPHAPTYPKELRRAIEPATLLNHPNILSTLEFGETEAGLFWISPYLPGEWLHDRLQRERQLPVPEALDLAGQIADALDYAHSRGIVHGDLSPGLLYLTAERVLVTDFGFALALQEAAPDGTFAGTLPYMSPERFTGGHQPDPRMDVYSLAALLYELLTGRPPYGSLPTDLYLRATGHHQPPSARKVRADIPRSVAIALQHALAPTPSARFQSPATFKAALMASS